MLPSHKIIIGVTGGIAAYKAAELTRLLVKNDFDVQIVMTESASHFITPLTFQALSGKEVLTSLWKSNANNGMSHIELSRDYDLIVIAPASANFLAKLTHGFADDLLSSLCLARTCPIAVAPAMNVHMWTNEATQRNVSQLKKDGVLFFGPDSGEQACGDIGLGRMVDTEELFRSIQNHLTPKILKNKKILITSGGTIEMIDDVRAITNLSSGNMGSAIANTAESMGASVTVIKSGNQKFSKNINVIDASNAHSMHEAVLKHIGGQDIFISVAAVSDYTPKEKFNGKLKKDNLDITLQLKPTIDILKEVGLSKNKIFKVGFAAETENLIENAQKKLRTKNLDLIVANLIHESMGLEDTKVSIIGKNDVIDVPKSNKIVAARAILKEIAHRINSDK
ncbi:bifunctional phosphopantothenoylcysteine decarboxylase/phosphopantothenate--cysteine ligase CoaBC [Candidatus Methylopumilus planktonicus]|nr:bifunctional phosphopantothenoylcysteine decarboxylase/phosphopantothenate--cysteine ligase CoaBC [Candidatus Methylopumilus planktonicus]QDD07814.1 bifunctional phosphopantothenoylcysteine decarboxylase/phosphopantothenate--cysteine ligase CoaBC [Candidatus Methylopumilus planktonicus]QDD09141.1 bifunctional phosphopantothenoylcysteine decarboxylase/phosphopantothenate--cysteine ligase CoaBC [Candidatus Methylopumilus planktonicus]